MLTASAKSSIRSSNRCPQPSKTTHCPNFTTESIRKPRLFNSSYLPPTLFDKKKYDVREFPTPQGHLCSWSEHQCHNLCPLLNLLYRLLVQLQLRHRDLGPVIRTKWKSHLHNSLQMNCPLTAWEVRIGRPPRFTRVKSTSSPHQQLQSINAKNRKRNPPTRGTYLMRREARWVLRGNHTAESVQCWLQIIFLLVIWNFIPFMNQKTQFSSSWPPLVLDDCLWSCPPRLSGFSTS